jgi:hypothetical protein
MNQTRMALVNLLNDLEVSLERKNRARDAVLRARERLERAKIALDEANKAHECALNDHQSLRLSILNTATGETSNIKSVIEA